MHAILVGALTTFAASLCNTAGGANPALLSDAVYRSEVFARPMIADEPIRYLPDARAYRRSAAGWNGHALVQSDEFFS